MFGVSEDKCNEIIYKHIYTNKLWANFDAVGLQGSRQKASSNSQCLQRIDLCNWHGSRSHGSRDFHEVSPDALNTCQSNKNICQEIKAKF